MNRKNCFLQADFATEKVVVENNSLSGDRAREAAKQAAESLKNQVREKLGEGGTALR
ncbi:MULTISPECIES: hypothetical protein [Citrobacter]|uniref:hypothetical protein n=1 Tax=Citrobacter TaxID=544 RepID=UPI001C0F7D90|nr:hypothetical protein [Citrobacter sp. S55_ASV_140]MBU5601594.1 hypothetical protein [Citrobacter sp. S55_ASV_140]